MPRSLLMTPVFSCVTRARVTLNSSSFPSPSTYWSVLPPKQHLSGSLPNPRLHIPRSGGPSEASRHKYFIYLVASGFHLALISFSISNPHHPFQLQAKGQEASWPTAHTIGPNSNANFGPTIWSSSSAPCPWGIFASWLSGRPSRPDPGILLMFPLHFAQFPLQAFLIPYQILWTWFFPSSRPLFPLIMSS